MAKVILVAETLNSTSWQLALALKSQQHEVTFLTHQSEAPDNSQGIEIMAYFKKWTWWEALKIIPALFGLQPQVLHILLERDRMNSAMMFLASYAKGHPTCILTTSLMHIQKGLTRQNPVRYLVEESDIVTGSSVEIMAHLRGLKVRSKNQGRAILPPMLNLSDDLRDHSSSLASDEGELLKILNSTPYVVLPYWESEFQAQSEWARRFLILARSYHVVLLGSQKHWSLSNRRLFAEWTDFHGLSSQWTLTGEASLGLTDKILKGAEALWLAGLSLTPSEMTEYYMKAIHHDCTLVLDHRQAHLHAALWKHGENVWILNAHQLRDEMHQLLRRGTLKTPTRLNDSISEQRHWIDIPLNELNRLYNKALMKL